MESDETLFDPMSDELAITKEALDKRVGDLSVRELIRLMVLIKKGRNPRILQYPDVKNNILDVIREYPGTDAYSIAKKLNVPYANVRYHIRTLEHSGVIAGKEIVDENKRVKVQYVVI
ncbi:MAG: hypothetical protein D4S01_08790 [Dehalococcoidia bacterium]|nr:MAG: hypothetical protein D4S01_08790 [Dehalococcoidia bacterium]